MDYKFTPEQLEEIEDSAEQKLARLLEDQSEWKFRSHKADRNNRVWEIVGASIRNKLDRFFRVTMLEVLEDDKFKYVQGLILQESKHFNKAEADKVIGKLQLPITYDRKNREIVAGIMAKKAIGAYGKKELTTPRASISNPVQLPDLEPSRILNSELMRCDAWRMTGRIKAEIVDAVGVEILYPKVDWFNQKEVYYLLGKKRIEDAPTNALLYNFLLNFDRFSERVRSTAILQISSK